MAWNEAAFWLVSGAALGLGLSIWRLSAEYARNDESVKEWLAEIQELSVENEALNNEVKMLKSRIAKLSITKLMDKEEKHDGE